MQSDLPHTLYLKDKKGTKAAGNAAERAKGKTKASDAVLRLQEEANRKARERRARQEAENPPVTIEELFSKD